VFGCEIKLVKQVPKSGQRRSVGYKSRSVLKERERGLPALITMVENNRGGGREGSQCRTMDNRAIFLCPPPNQKPEGR
jgi:hypothetical protein